jgi:hypothetical protein
MDIFRQILELDEDDSDEFSRAMAQDYFSQANTTFKEMDEAMYVYHGPYSTLKFVVISRSPWYIYLSRVKKDLATLSALGHFLKGSSAALGVSKVQASCEKIQHYGKLRDEEAGVDLTKEEALGKIEKLLVEVKREYKVAENWLRKWYKDSGTGRGEPPSNRSPTHSGTDHRGKHLTT